MSLKVAVVGSFRENEKCFQYKRTLDEFHSICFLIGQELSKHNEVEELIVSIPNDLNEKQSGYVKTKTGYDREYKFEHTADYLAMTGFLSNCSITGMKKIKLFIPQVMISGGTSKDHKINIKPFWENTFLDAKTGVTHSLKSYKNFFEVELIDPNKLRTMIVQQYVAGELDLLITIGGGKATDAVYSVVKEKKDILSIPHFLGTSLKYFANALKRKVEIFGKSYNSIFTATPKTETIEFICSTAVEDIDSLIIPIKELDLTSNDLAKEVKNILNRALPNESKLQKSAIATETDSTEDQVKEKKPWYKSDAFKIQIAAVIATFLLSTITLYKCNSTEKNTQVIEKDSMQVTPASNKPADSIDTGRRVRVPGVTDATQLQKMIDSDIAKGNVTEKAEEPYLTNEKKNELLSAIAEARIKLKLRQSSFIIMSTTRTTNGTILFSEIKKVLFDNNIRTVDLNSFQIEEADNVILRKLNGHLNIVVGTIEKNSFKCVIKDFR